MLAIHKSEKGFHPRWRKYCELNAIPYKSVDCYSSDLISDLKGCTALLWHHHQEKTPDVLIAKSILFALEHSGLKVFPNFKTGWHFDDKIAQKYLLESFELPLVPSYVFYNKNDALNWISETSLPKVFKLKGGAGSVNVKLIKTIPEARKLLNRSFGRGFSAFSSRAYVKEKFYKYKIGSISFSVFIKSLYRLFRKPEFSRVSGKELGYAYFQDFISNNDSDTRIVVIDGKAFALKRMVRKGDFRASGSGVFSYDKNEINLKCVELAFKANDVLKTQCIALDFVFDHKGSPLIIEISYGFSPSGYDSCTGYWDKNLVWFEGEFNHEGWMIESLIKELEKNKNN